MANGTNALALRSNRNALARAEQEQNALRGPAMTFLPFELHPSGGGISGLAVPSVISDTFESIGRLMSANPPGTIGLGNVDPGDLLAVTPAMGLAGRVAGPTGAALGAGGTRSPIGRALARERAMERRRIHEMRMSDDPAVWGQVPLTMGRQRSLDLARQTAMGDRQYAAAQFAHRMIRKDRKNKKMWTQLRDDLETALGTGQTRRASEIMARIEGLRGATFRTRASDPLLQEADPIVAGPLQGRLP